MVSCVRFLPWYQQEQAVVEGFSQEIVRHVGRSVWNDLPLWDSLGSLSLTGYCEMDYPYVAEEFLISDIVARV